MAGELVHQLDFHALLAEPIDKFARCPRVRDEHIDLVHRDDGHEAGLPQLAAVGQHNNLIGPLRHDPSDFGDQGVCRSDTAFDGQTVAAQESARRIELLQASQRLRADRGLMLGEEDSAEHEQVVRRPTPNLLEHRDGIGDKAQPARASTPDGNLAGKVLNGCARVE